MQWLGIVLLICCVSCGKVAQDITEQNDVSVFKASSFKSVTSDTEFFPWQELVSSLDARMVYVYYEGITMDYGAQRIGWASASSLLKRDTKTSSNVLTVFNYDSNKNTVTGARYQQGMIKLNIISTDNYRLNVEFKKVRPKFDYYIMYQYLSKDDYLLNVSDQVVTESIEISPYSHLISLTFLQHLQKESYRNADVIPLSFFETIIPTSAAGLVSNLMPTNNMTGFNNASPKFSFEDDVVSTLIGVVSLAKHSDVVDAVGYIDEQESVVFSDDLKQILTESVESYFEISDVNPDVLDEMDALIATSNVSSQDVQIN